MNTKKFAIFLLVIIIAGYAAYKTSKKKTPPPQVAAQTSSSKQTATSSQVEGIKQTFESLDGEQVDEAVAHKRPLAVMIENYPDARPQSGLLNADLVYEALTEGGITRFMAVYQTQSSSNIGPVRSARLYYADLANELGAVYAHVGGNSDVLKNIKAGQYKNISDADQFFNDPYFQRIKTRQAPHNVYTSTDKLTELANSHQYSLDASYEPWIFKDVPSDSKLPSAVSLDIDFSEPDYEVSYDYDKTVGLYKRYLAGKPHTDLDTKKQITAKNVIIQYVNIYPVKSDTPLSIGMTLTGEGSGVVFMDGKVIQATWKKTDTGRTRYYDASGKEIAFNRGQTWVELVPNDGELRVTWR